MPAQGLRQGRLGLIAGGGGLPAAIAADCDARGRDVFVVRLKGHADASLAKRPGVDAGLAELGKCLRALASAGCEHVCFAGLVRRPDNFAALKPDLIALKHLPGVIAAAGQGDDALLRAVLAVFEREGLVVEALAQAAPGLLLGPGALGAIAPDAQDRGDIALAAAAAREVGRTDIAQGAVARNGEVIAREDRRGTDEMLAGLAASPERRGGVLAKLPKPGQDRRVDLPTIGVKTIALAAAAGLKGVVGEPGGLLVVDRDAVCETADRLGLFVWGLQEGGR